MLSFHIILLTYLLKSFLTQSSQVLFKSPLHLIHQYIHLITTHFHI